MLAPMYSLRKFTAQPFVLVLHCIPQGPRCSRSARDPMVSQALQRLRWV